jgi:uncharacterized protein YjbJ (UPF0337 family)
MLPVKTVKEFAMNKDTLKGKWKQLTGEVKRQWGKLTDDDLQQIEGDSEKLEGKIQERYGIGRDEARKQIEDFQRRI